MKCTFISFYFDKYLSVYTFYCHSNCIYYFINTIVDILLPKISTNVLFNFNKRIHFVSNSYCCFGFSKEKDYFLSQNISSIKVHNIHFLNNKHVQNKYIFL